MTEDNFLCDNNNALLSLEILSAQRVFDLVAVENTAVATEFPSG